MDMALHPPCRGRRPFLLACRSGAADVICLPCPATAAAARPPFSLFRLHPTAATLRNVRNAQRKRKSPVARRLELCSWRGLSAPHGNCRSSPAAFSLFRLHPTAATLRNVRNAQRKRKSPAARRQELCCWRELSVPPGNCRFPFTPPSGHPEKYAEERERPRRPEAGAAGQKGGNEGVFGPWRADQSHSLWPME